MKLYLNHQPKKAEKGIHHAESMFFFGSCFSEHIYTKLIQAGFQAHSNPNGIVFNPISVFKQLHAIAKDQIPDTDFFIKRNERCFSLQAHSSLSAENEAQLLELLTSTNQIAKNHLVKSSQLFITFGTAWYYTHLALNAPVANCQKLPAACFAKHLATIQEINDEAQTTIDALLHLNPNLQIIFTVSPVRHLRDGIEENFLSKSILRAAIFDICNRNKNCSYFSAYELVNDDLKDYRFYEEDLAHPDAKAINYVWEKFCSTYMSPKTQELSLLFEKKAKLLQHNSLHSSESSAQLQQEYITQINAQIAQLMNNENQRK